MAAATSIKLEIASEIGLVDLVHEVSEKMAQFAGFPPDESLNVGLAVREAVINAIVHGNGQDSSRKVEVLIETRQGEGIRAQVRDQGNGFDPESAPDPTEVENILNASGRGLLLIRAFVDDVDFKFKKGRGMEVTLVKKLPESQVG